MQGNTIFITGGSSGIGGALAAAFHRRGNHIIISGRRKDRLKAICARHPGMDYVVLDVTDPNSMRSAAHKLTSDSPALNCVFNGCHHSWTMTLRFQGQKLGVRVIELIPPYVGTELGRPRKQANDLGRPETSQT